MNETAFAPMPESTALMRDQGRFVRWTRRLPVQRTTLGALTLIASTGFGSLMGFIFWLLAARRFPSEDVGLASALLTSVMLLTAIANLGMGIGIVQFLPEKDDAAMAMVDVALTIVMTLTGAVVAGFLLGAPFWAAEAVKVRGDLWFALLLFLVAIATSVGQIYDQVFVARDRADLVGLRSLVNAALSPLLILFLPSSLGALAIFGASGGPLVLVSLVTAYVLVRRWSGWRPPRPARSLVAAGPVIRAALPNHIGQLVWLAPPAFFSLLIIHALGAQANGPFYVAWMIANLLNVVPRAVASVYLAAGARSAAAPRQTAGRSLFLSLALLLPVTVAMASVAPLLLRMFGTDYGAATPLARLLLLASLPSAVIWSALVELRLHQRFWAVSGISSAMLMVALLATQIGIGRHGLTAVGFGWLISQILVAAWIGTGCVRAAFGDTVMLGRSLMGRRLGVKKG